MRSDKDNSLEIHPSSERTETEPTPRDGENLLSQEERREDTEDLDNARDEEEMCQVEEHKPFWKCLGLGLITGAADDDPSGIGSYSVTGAQFGYRLLWLTPACIPLRLWCEYF